MTTIYQVWIKEVYRVITLRFSDKDAESFKSKIDWEAHYNNRIMPHEAVTISCG